MEYATSNSIGAALGTAVRARRKALGLTQDDLARLARCGSLFVVKLERGKDTVRLDKLIDVLTVLGLQLSLENGVAGLTVK
jgi:HTH-type transcriptional regulator/antitoxin HipB